MELSFSQTPCSVLNLMGHMGTPSFEIHIPIHSTVPLPILILNEFYMDLTAELFVIKNVENMKRSVYINFSVYSYNH